ncbi:MAG: hypothetical protein KBC41_00180 [Candidatus Pacebacteria bacterium]|nr:hypothetical protein [Candidatus Paceibacterota bacterium]MBP9866484.1 hypothetical protein [Candidatus Paceibacterota bacterium]
MEHIEDDKNCEVEKNNAFTEEKIFIRGIGMISLAQATEEAKEEVIGDIFVGNGFTLANLEKIEEDASDLRRDGLVTSEELRSYHDQMIKNIERKLIIREALKMREFEK